jgi:hypothetical protein
MKRTLPAACMAVTLLSLTGSDLGACGDKSLSAGGIRMQRALAARYPASVLIYTPSASPLNSAARELDLQKTLRLVGHTYREVASETDLQAQVDSGHYNILLADIGDAAALQARFESSPSRVVVVPVLYKPTKAEAAEAAKQSRFLIKAPGRAAQYLTTIAEAVASRGATPRRV